MKKSKKATVGTKIAEDVATTCEPYGLICLNLGEKKNLARKIDAAIRRAVREAYESGCHTGYYKVNPCRNGEEGAALAVVVDSYCASSQAELAALRAKWEALAGVLRWVSENTSDENTSQYIRAMTITLTDSTHALENP